MVPVEGTHAPYPAECKAEAVRLAQSSDKAELVERRHWATRAAARTAIFAWIEVCYNRQRAHSALAYQPPARFEEALLQNSVA